MNAEMAAAGVEVGDRVHAADDRYDFYGTVVNPTVGALIHVRPDGRPESKFVPFFADEVSKLELTHRLQQQVEDLKDDLRAVRTANRQLREQQDIDNRRVLDARHKADRLEKELESERFDKENAEARAQHLEKYVQEVTERAERAEKENRTLTFLLRMLQWVNP